MLGDRFKGLDAVWSPIKVQSAELLEDPVRSVFVGSNHFSALCPGA